LVIGYWLFVIGKKEESEAADYSPMTHDCDKIEDLRQKTEEKRSDS
jgi:hypothetical protein